MSRIRQASAEQVLGAVVRTLVALTVLIGWFALAPLDGEHAAAGRSVGVLLIVSSIVILALRMRRVLHFDHPIPEAVSTVVVSAALLVIGPAATYLALSADDSTSFQGLETKVDAIYFSVTLVSTTGFGDISPSSQTARALTSLHIITTLVLVGVGFKLIAWAARRNVEAATETDET